MKPIAIAFVIPLAAVAGTSHEPQVNCLTDEEKTAGWKLLFDGKSTAGWHTFNAEGVDKRWHVSNGELVLDPSPTRRISGADLETEEAYGDFDLSVDWKISPGGNSGIIYRVAGEGYAHPWEIGPEYQLLDNTVGKDPPEHQSGAVWDFYAPIRDVTRPIGQYNVARIIVRNGHVEHWLNGVKLLSYELGSQDFKERHRRSSFSQWADYGLVARGTIVLQDEGRLVSFRNIKIRRLN